VMMTAGNFGGTDGSTTVAVVLAGIVTSRVTFFPFSFQDVAILRSPRLRLPWPK